MDLLKALQQTMMPGNRIPRVGSWDELKQYPMPVDCEGVFIDRDPNKDYIYMKRTDANGVEVCAKYQSIQQSLNRLGIETANNNLETYKAITDQNMVYQNQNNTNMINVIQGFNNLSQRIDQLGFKMESCCCEIKTQMLEQALAAAQADKVRLQGQIDNRDQTQTLLNALGRFVAWAGSGAQTASAAG